MTHDAPRTLTYHARRTWVWLTAWLFCTLGTLSLVANTTTARIDPDEVYWIGSTYFYHLAFEQGDWLGSHPDWQLLPARENPPVAKYVLGLGLAISGRHVTTLDGLGSFYAYFKSKLGAPDVEHAAKQAPVMARMDQRLYERVSRERQMYVAPDLLVAARRVSLVCAVVTSLLVFLFGVSISGPATGLVASQLLLLHPAVRFAYDHAMADAVGYMFGTAAALSVWLLFRRLEGSGVSSAVSSGVSSAVLSGVLSGVLLGLAVAAKMNWLTVILLLGATVGFVASQAWRRGDRSRATLALGTGAAALATAFVVFVLVNPAIVADPMAGLVAVVREPQLTTAVQARVTEARLFSTVGLKLKGVAVLMLGSPSVFIVLLGLIAWACVRAPRVGVWFVAAWWTIAFVCVAAWIPFEWKRYVLPLVIPFVLLLAHALVAAGSRLIRRNEPARD